METAEDRARRAYQAYGDSTGGLNYQGLPMPAWANLGDAIRAAWRAAAAAALPEARESVTVYVSIGNTDGKLSHAEWAEYHGLAAELLTEVGFTSAVYGNWHSLPATPYVNACWAVEIPAVHVEAARHALAALARRFRQDSIAWAEATTEFIAPDGCETD